MMKKLVIAVMCVVLANVALATIFVSWGGPSGFVRNDGSTPLVEEGWNALAQLIFTADGTHGDAYTDGSSEGNTVLAWTVFNNDTLFNDYGAGFAGENHSNSLYTTGSGYLFVRVFDRGSDGGLVADMWYHDGANFATLENTAIPPATPDDVNAGDSGTGDGPFGTYILNSGQVQDMIPEPATWAMMGFGALMLFIRRRRLLS